MQKQSKLNNYNIKYDSFDFLCNPHMQLFHIVDYTLPKNQIQELHYHDAIEIGICEKGSGIFIIDGEIISFSSPCATIIYPNQLHKAKSEGENQSVWKFVTVSPKIYSEINFSKDIYQSIFNSNNKNLNLIKSDDIIFILIKELINELIFKEINYLESAKGLIKAILIKHNRLISDQNLAFINNISCIVPIINYVTKNYKNNYTIKELADIFNISCATLRRWFKNEIGLSPSEYIHKVRMITASCLLLNSNLSILDISLEVGYQSQSTFQRHFKSYFACSPTEYLFKNN